MKVREVGLSGRSGEGILSLSHHTVSVLYQHFPRIPPADLPSAMTVALKAAGVPLPFFSVSGITTMDELRHKQCQYFSTFPIQSFLVFLSLLYLFSFIQSIG